METSIPSKKEKEKGRGGGDKKENSVSLTFSHSAGSTTINSHALSPSPLSFAVLPIVP